MNATQLAPQVDLREPKGFGFDETSHRYSLRGLNLRPVSSIIAQHKRPFDELAQAQRVAMRDERPVADVLAEWRAKRDTAMQLGKDAHEVIDRALRAGSPLALDHESPHVRAAMRWVAQRQSEGMQIVATEARLAWVERGIAGTIDALAWHRGAWTLLDWKTNEKLTLQAEPHWRNAKMLDPVAHLDDCHGSHYALQLALYALILREVYGVHVKRRLVIHLRGDGTWGEHELPSLDEEARDLVTAQWEW